MYAQPMRKHLILALILLRAPLAAGQGASRLYPTGAEAKTHGGAGQTQSVGAPANYYNPANLARTSAAEVYGELDFIVVDYTFEYPGEDPVEIRIRTPAPFLGFAFAPTSELTLAFSALALPGGKGNTLKDFPTRTFAEDADSDPILLDVESGSKGISYQSALGASYRIAGSYAVGLSLLLSGGTSTLKATEADGDGVLIESRSKSYNYQLLIGGRGSWLEDRLEGVLTVHLPSRGKSKGRIEYPALDGGVDTSSESTGPWAAGVGVSYRVTDKLTPFAEVLHTNWKALSEGGRFSVFNKVDVDYYDTNDVSLGADYAIGKNAATLAAGFYQSELGDGVMAKESDDGKELAGFEMQNVESIGFSTYAAGYRFVRKQGHLQTGFTYTSGDREIGKKSRGYGSYELRYYSIVAGGVWRI